jgi:hypothetical protein
MRKPYLGADVLYRVFPDNEHYKDFPFPVRPAKVIRVNDDGSVELAVMGPDRFLKWSYDRVYAARYDTERDRHWFWPDPPGRD